ncbi:MAG: 4-(cytidine 5'-diphospho)-2-C-methyl-D-erythritol kinase [Burkholderiales bacterium]|nr:4-(cytidine 5'-diphospho)-2-C-methyl-D-erythritol kinase [Burkholderiales bacterium]
MAVLKSLHSVPAPAKLNLFLHITGRRPDGYHLLESVFMLIDWWDLLHFDLLPGGELQRRDLTMALPADDLCLRAARLLQQASGTDCGVRISIEKRLPAQAGMGGGSSDAATTLLALNRLWGLNWPLSRLLPLGLSLGADVPFFLRGRNAWVQGIGEQIQPLFLPAARFAVLKPEQGLETALIFKDEALIRDSSPATMADFAARPYAFGRNDLQAVARHLCPQVDQSLEWFSRQGLRPGMTGSGSAVFARISSDTVLSDPPAGWQLQLCSNLEIHPLAGWVSCDV